MDRGMNRQRLMHKSLVRFALCTALLLALATPAFYWLTKSFYAEDMVVIIDAVAKGGSIPDTDLEKDVMQGVTLQFGLIAAVFGIAVILMLRFISHRLWRPFEDTLAAIEDFRIEDGRTLRLPPCDTVEFDRLNSALSRMTEASVSSYNAQKEFTSNASHELQTPLAVFRSKLDTLMQLPGLTERQAAIVQDLYQAGNRLSRISRDLLLLAKIDNRQFERSTPTDLVQVLGGIRPYTDTIADGTDIKWDICPGSMVVKANRTLLESLATNLIVNAVRHNAATGRIRITLDGSDLSVSNTGSGHALDARHIFDRFYRGAHSGNDNGYGLGLAIAKAVCDYHGWKIEYSYTNGDHTFTVHFF